MGLSRMVDHIKPLLRPKSDQQFSHSLGTKQTLRFTASGSILNAASAAWRRQMRLHVSVESNGAESLE